VPDSDAPLSQLIPEMPADLPGSGMTGSTVDLATDDPKSWPDRILGWVPRILSSKPHVIVLIGLGVYLIVLPLAGVNVSAKSELIGGNYTNVTSDIGACIAAGGTLHLISQNRKRSKVEAERLRLALETHRLLHYVCRDAALQLGHSAMGEGPGAKPAPGEGPGAKQPFPGGGPGPGAQ
jgi:hypothetical protein